MQASSATVYALTAGTFIREAEAILESPGEDEVLTAYTSLGTIIKYPHGCEDCPTNTDLRFLHAYTGTIALTILDPFYGTTFNLDEMAIPCDYYFLDNDNSSEQKHFYPTAFADPLTSLPKFTQWIMPNAVYDTPGFRTYIEVNAIPHIDVILANYDYILSNDPDFSFTLKQDVSGLYDDIEIDHSDIMIFRSIMLLIKAKLQLQIAYDLEIKARDPLNEELARFTTAPEIQSAVLENYPFFLTLAPTPNNPNNGITLVTAAKESFVKGIEGLKNAFASINLETDDQLNDYHILDATRANLEDQIIEIFSAVWISLNTDTPSTTDHIQNTYNIFNTNSDTEYEHQTPLGSVSLSYGHIDQYFYAADISIVQKSGGSATYRTAYIEFEDDYETTYIEGYIKNSSDPDNTEYPLGIFWDTVNHYSDWELEELNGLGLFYVDQSDDDWHEFYELVGILTDSNHEPITTNLNPIFGGTPNYREPISLREFIAGNNDFCLSAVKLTLDSLTEGTTVDMSGIDITMLNEYDFDYDITDVWYSFTAGVSGLYQIQLQGFTDAGATVAIFDQCDATQMLAIGYYPRGDGETPPSSNQQFSFVAGERYLLRVAGLAASESAFSIVVNHVGAPLVNDHCENAIPLTLDETIYGSNDNATGIEFTSCGFKGNPHGVWYSFTPMVSAQYSVTTTYDETLDSTVTLYADCADIVNKHYLACTNNNGVGNIQENITMEMTADTTYLIRIGGDEGDKGTFALNVSPTEGKRLMTSVIGNGSIAPNDATLQTTNETVVITATPDAGWIVSAWTIDGVTTPSSALTQSVVMDNHKMVEVTFIKDAFILTINEIIGNGTIDPGIGSYTYNKHDNIVITALPADGWRLKSWMINGQETTPAELTIAIAIEIDTTVQAIFELITYTLTVEINNGNGIIDPSAGDHNYLSGEEVTVTATPDADWRIDAWFIDGVEIPSDALSRSITINSDTTVAVSFSQIKVTLQFSQIISGGIPDVLPSNSVSNTLTGETQHLSAHPIPNGYRVSHWIGTKNDNSRLETNTVLMDRNKEAFVVFAKSLKPAKTEVIAGKNRGGDYLKIKGSFDATISEIVLEKNIHIDVWSENGFSFSTTNPIPLNAPKDIKKNVFTYKSKVKKNDGAKVTNFSFTLKKHMGDLKQQTFSLTIKNLDLTGLGSPLFTRITIGSYVGIVEASEDSINGKGRLPQIFMRSFADTLRVKGAKIKNGKSTDTLSVSGAITAVDNSVLLSEEDVIITWSGQSFVIPAGTFKEPKKGQKYSVKHFFDQHGNKVTAKIDLLKCTFKITVKKGHFNSQQVKNYFGIRFGNYDNSVDLDMKVKGKKLSVYTN